MPSARQWKTTSDVGQQISKVLYLWSLSGDNRDDVVFDDDDDDDDDDYLFVQRFKHPRASHARSTY